jgi:hypothetical protein
MVGEVHVLATTRPIPGQLRPIPTITTSTIDGTIGRSVVERARASCAPLPRARSWESRRVVPGLEIGQETRTGTRNWPARETWATLDMDASVSTVTRV